MSNKEFCLQSVPNFTKYLKENFGEDIKLGEFSDIIKTGSVIIQTSQHVNRIGPHSLEIIILLNEEKIGKFQRYVIPSGGFTALNYSGKMPCYYNSKTKDSRISLSAHYEGEYPLWVDLETIDKKLLTRVDGHYKIPFP